LPREETALAPVSREGLRTPSIQNPSSDGAATDTGGRPGFVLSATSGSLANQHFPISLSGLRIGRSPDNDVILNEPMVSRHHAEIVQREGVYGIRDLGSTNGTYVDGVRVFERALQSGNRVRVGLAEFVFHPAGMPVPVASHPVVSPRPAPAGGHGRPFNGYTLEELIGGGGMAQVYRAVTPAGLNVAIKIPTVANDPYLMRKFVREGDAIGRLLRGHPYIVQVEHFGFTHENEPYIVMEYVDGGSLRDRARQPMREEDIRRIVGQTCLALGFAHQNQIVHRDIKPENILLTAAGQAKVADFGIARELSGFTVTHNGPIGTPEYMSPEQARGENVQPASDVYAAGVVLYELLTGRVPFPRRTTISDDVQQALNVVERHISEPPKPPRAVTPSASPELETVVMKALEKKPGRRYTNGAEMALALGLKPVKSTVAAAPLAAPPASHEVGLDTARGPGRLVVVQGPARGQAIAITGDMLEIGRPHVDPNNTAISRRHAILRRRGSDFWLEDISVNGTWVNEIRIRGEQMLSSGDCIRIADSVLRLET
jgi:pSer/pThr/pTyr-binding forkhead associated (FHA) protein